MKKIIVLFLCASFTASGQVNFQSSDLPIVIINTNGQTIPDEPKITAQMKVIDNGPGQVNHISDPPNNYNGFIGIERRGSTSQDLSDKKPYAVETRDAAGQDIDVPLLGMPPEADWVFIAPYNDKSLVRDALALELARRIMPWASRGRFVELMLNGQYQGVYFVAEKIKRDKNRVDISNLTETDLAGDELTGGYILKMDKTTGEASEGWVSPYPAQQGSWQSTLYQFHYPQPENILPVQAQYIEDWITEFEDLMTSQNYADPLTGYPKYLDIQSFVDFVIINEMTKNVDAYRLSTFFYKDKDSKNSRLFAGPVWDFNIAMGNADYCVGPNHYGWVMDFNTVCPQDFWIIHFWWRRLWDDPGFRERLRDRWVELRGDAFTDTKVTGILDSLVGVVQQAQVRNWQRWPVLNTWVWPNVFCCGTYAQHVDYLRNWLLDRMEWMDGAMISLSAEAYDSPQYFNTEIFPNPTDNLLTFKYHARHSDQVLIRISDVTGRQAGLLNAVPKADGENFQTLTHSLAQGLYFYSVIVNNNVKAGGKFVVQRD